MDFLMFQLEKNSLVPIYEQLYSEIKDAIINGAIKEGEKLPSKRNLAEYLAVSQTTIEFAYSQLVAEGFISSEARKGYYVQSLEELALIEQEAPIFTQEEKITDVISIDFSPGKIDTESFPFAIWRKYAKEIVSEVNKDFLQLGHPQGDYILRQQISAYLYQSRGVKCTAEQIILGSGTEQLMPLIIRLLGQEAIYGIENPGYPLTHHLFLDDSQKSVPIPVDAEGILVSQLEETNATVMYVTPSHQFPTGAVLSATRRSQLLSWAYQQDNRYIIEDDYDSEFRYTGRPIPSLQGIDQNQRVIYLSTFSKSLMPSLRIAYAVLPKSLITLYKQKYSYYAATVPRMDQHLLAKFMEDGYFAKHLNKMRKIYKRKLEIVTKTIAKFNPIVTISGEQAGMHLLLTIQTSKSEEELVLLAKQAGIRVYGLREYVTGGLDSLTEPKIVLGFGGLEANDIQTSITTLIKAWGIAKTP
ncbi:PLP-dependent aminotransferase family protein [Psychrobacillus vulpis]|uniref:PLP-dependent aminotransferase family protein n=1 Tax=Psychrobacillus vulpis TaxID=2325572 RepID=A0A544TGL6_9BACI|nr:PLP-dependent aminotransferase family protein [Psychrobacillus vulpis]TQR16581.1 PLP-dependent aminotransferase family protein [Psychrobacillus vulpis]